MKESRSFFSAKDQKAPSDVWSSFLFLLSIGDSFEVKGTHTHTFPISREINYHEKKWEDWKSKNKEGEFCDQTKKA